MAVEQYTTLGQSTLSGSYTSGGSSLSVTSASSFPTAGNFRVRVDSEIFKVTAVSGTTFTVTGAQEGTSAANHSSGAAITEYLTALALDAIRSDVNQSGAYASLPSTTGQKVGNIYICTDKSVTYVFNGSAWVQVPTGSLVLLEQHTASSSASLDFTASITSAYDDYIVKGINLVPATDGANALLRFSADGGSTYIATSTYTYSYLYGGTGSASGVVGSGSSDTSIHFSNANGNGANKSFSFSMELFDPLAGTVFPRVMFDVTQVNTDVNSYRYTGQGSYNAATALNAFQIRMSSGNIASGIVRCYGIAK